LEHQRFAAASVYFFELFHFSLFAAAATSKSKVATQSGIRKIHLHERKNLCAYFAATFCDLICALL